MKETFHGKIDLKIWIQIIFYQLLDAYVTNALTINAFS